MGLLSNRVDTSQIKAGDHIYTYRVPFIYSHHGIYFGGNRVAHFTRRATSTSEEEEEEMIPSLLFCSDCGFKQRKHGECGVILTCLDCFLQNGALYSFQYGVSSFSFLAKFRGGTCTTLPESDSPETVIHRAMYLLENGYGKYDLFRNNCEDFALYCKTGLLTVDSLGSGRSGQASALISIQLAPLLSSPLKLVMPSSPLGVAAVTLGMYSFSRYATDIGVRSDVMKVAVEDMESLNLFWPTTDKDDLTKFWNLVGAMLLFIQHWIGEKRRKFTKRGILKKKKQKKKTSFRLKTLFSQT